MPPLRPFRSRARGGFTLVELIVVLAIMGLSAVVVTTMRPPAPEAQSAEAIVTRARRLAVQRAQLLTLDLGSDGRWTVVAPHAGVGGVTGGDTVASGLGDRPAAPVSMTIDAMGSCHPDQQGGGASFDPLRCRWRLAETPR